jgi:hypothetical protein
MRGQLTFDVMRGCRVWRGIIWDNIRWTFCLYCEVYEKKLTRGIDFSWRIDERVESSIVCQGGSVPLSYMDPNVK